MEWLFVTCAVGMLCGWLVALKSKGGGIGFAPNVALGVGGAVLGAVILKFLGVRVGGDVVAAAFNAAIGAGVVLAASRVVARRA